MKTKNYEPFGELPIDSDISLDEIGEHMETFYDFLIENNVEIKLNDLTSTGNKYNPDKDEFIDALMDLEKSFILGKNIGLPNVDDMSLITFVVKKIKSLHINTDKALRGILTVVRIISALNGIDIEISNHISIENDITYNFENNVTCSTQEANKCFEDTLSDLNIRKDELLTLSDDSNSTTRILCTVAKQIKQTAALKGTSVNAMLKTCHLGKNTIDKMSNGSDIVLSNFIKIADYLDVSADYLLGRTDSPTAINSHNTVNGSNNIIGNGSGNRTENALSEQESALMNIFNKLDVVSQAKLLVYATELEKEKE